MSTLDNLEYATKLPNENHEEIKLSCEVGSIYKTPRVTVEVPAYNDPVGGVKEPRMYVTMTLDEFDAVVAGVHKFRNMMEVANV